MRQYWFPKPYADFVARLRVPIGFLLVAAFAWLSRPSPLSLCIGASISFAGIALRAWAAGHLSKNTELATSGPYAYVRNPLYLGTLIAALGFVIASRESSLGILFAAVFVFVYLPVVELEEQHLRKLFPEYGAYASRVKMLIPSFGYRGAGRKFQWRLYMRNQEFQALLGFLAGIAFLAWKAWAAG
ncbi:MAG TPA: isoprenylcysteine carboxylmethyltransferase family protein [Bryobacteraceae bacterium]|nr:isoprenylcysteine carboxylmethyltransferase family protein [Bryobacteraceae bacterium]